MRVEKCEFSRFINAYLDGELSEEKQKALFGHMKECSFCTQELDSLQKLNSQLSEFDYVSLPSSLKDSIIRNARVYEASQSKQSRFIRKVSSLAVAASIILSLIGGTLLGTQIFEHREKQNYEEVAFAQESFYVYFEGE